MKSPSILPNRRERMQIDTFGNALMFYNYSAYPHGPAKQKIIEKFLRTLLMFSYCMPILTDQQGRKNELEKRL